MYEFQLLFSSQKPKAKDFRKHCFNVMFPHTRQQLTNKMDEDHQQAIIEIQGGHQQAITDRDNRIQAIQYENVEGAGANRCLSGSSTKM